MAIFIFLLVVLAILFGLVFLKVFRNTFKAFSLLFFTALFVSVILIFFFIQDAQAFQNSFSHDQTIYLLDDNGTLIAGFAMKGLNFSSFVPIPIEDLEDYFLEDSDRIRVVVKRSALSSSLQTGMTAGYSLGQAVESPDYQLRAAGFLVGVGELIRQDSIFVVAKLVRNGKIALFPETFVIKVLTFDSKAYKSLLQEQYIEKKSSVYDALGVREKEVNASELSE